MAVSEAFQDGAAASAQVLATLFEDSKDIGWALYAMLVGALSIIRAVPDAEIRDKIRHDTERAYRMNWGDDGADETS
jgi:hypothetical protein